VGTTHKNLDMMGNAYPTLRLIPSISNAKRLKLSIKIKEKKIIEDKLLQ
jgi:hypothetical protein